MYVQRRNPLSASVFQASENFFTPGPSEFSVIRAHRKWPTDTSPDGVMYHRLQAQPLNRQLTPLQTADTWQKQSWMY